MRRPETITLVVTLGLLALGAWREHARLGVEMQYLTLVALLAGPSLRRAFSLPSWHTLPLEIAALTGLVAYPVGDWALPFAALAATVASLPAASKREKASPIAHLLCLAAFSAAVYGLSVRGAQDSRGAWAIWPLAAMTVEALLPPFRFAQDDVLRRTSGFLIVAAAARLHGHFGYRAKETECQALAAAAVVAVFAVADWIGRIRSRDEERLVRRRRRFAFGVVAVAIPLALVWAGGEVVFRLLGRTAPRAVSIDAGADAAEFTYHVPGKRYVFEAPPGPAPPERLTRNEFTWNKEGFHDADHEREKKPHSVRVLVLGDSFVEGCQLPLDDLLHRRLEPLLAASGAPVETMAYGWSGWGQVHELAVLREKGAAYSPDLVLLEFYPPNDLGDNFAEIREQRNPTLAGLLANVFSYRGLVFAAKVADRFDHLRFGSAPASVDDEVFRTDLSEERAALWERAWKQADGLIGDVATVASGQLAVVIFPWSEAVSADPATPRNVDFALPRRRMAAICAARSVPCLDLTPRFAALSLEERSHLFLKGDGHWSRNGHAVAAREVARFLTEETSIWRDVVSRRSR